MGGGDGGHRDFGRASREASEERRNVLRRAAEAGRGSSSGMVRPWRRWDRPHIRGNTDGSTASLEVGNRGRLGWTHLILWMQDAGMRNLWQFLVAAGALGGGSVILAIILFIVAVIEHLRDRNVGAAWLFMIGCLAFCFGSFAAWKDERASLDERTAQVNQLQQQIGSLTHSQVAAEIEFSILGAQGHGSHAGLIVSLRNAGAETAVVPDSWRLVAITANGTPFEGWANTLKDKNLDFCIGPHSLMRFVRADALYLKASAHPIGRNGFEQGFLWYSFPDLQRSQLVSPDTRLVLSATTVSGQTVQAEISIKELSLRSNQPTRFFPGIENPRLLDEPCQENQPY